jgi:hypothetical protein
MIPHYALCDKPTSHRRLEQWDISPLFTVLDHFFKLLITTFPAILAYRDVFFSRIKYQTAAVPLSAKRANIVHCFVLLALL